jgi:ferredoxin
LVFTIEHDKANCIGCGACAAVATGFWEMQGDKSHLKGAKPVGTVEQRVIQDQDQKTNLEAAQSCPVNAIHIRDANGKQVI